MIEPKNELPEIPRVDLHLPAITLFKAFSAAVLVALLMRLTPLFMLLFLAILISVTLSPAFKWMEKRAPRWLAIAVLAVAIVGAVALFFVAILPSIAEQISTFVKDFPKLREQIMEQLPPGFIHSTALKLFRGEALPGQSPWMQHFLEVGQSIAGVIFALFVVLVLALYLVVDGPATYRWAVAFFAPKQRMKIHATSAGVSEVIFAYVAGQLITSLLVFVFALVVLWVLHVPAALTLAVLAGVFDVLPVLGFFLAGGPAVLLALTVSPTTALIVLGFYLFYHGLESYFIVPKVYGNRLRLSTLTVLVSLLAADLIAGIVGAIVVLPIVASYPIIEKIWLAPFLRDSTLEKHSDEDEKSKA